MEPYFSNNYAPNPPAVQLYKQQLFIDARDYVDDIIANEGRIEFDVKWSNGRHTARKRVEQGTDQYGNPAYVNVVNPDASWDDSLSIPPYYHVTQVELLGVMCPKVNLENYFIVDIPEFDRVIHSSDNSGSHEKFAVVYFDSSEKALKGKDFAQKLCVFNPPLQSLNKIHVQFKKYGGSVLNLTSDFNHNGLNFDINNNQSVMTALSKVSLLLEFTIKT